jgi:hypothetical protein
MDTYEHGRHDRRDRVALAVPVHAAIAIHLIQAARHPPSTRTARGEIARMEEVALPVERPIMALHKSLIYISSISRLEAYYDHKMVNLIDYTNSTRSTSPPRVASTAVISHRPYSSQGRSSSSRIDVGCSTIPNIYTSPALIPAHRDICSYRVDGSAMRLKCVPLSTTRPFSST